MFHCHGTSFEFARFTHSGKALKGHPGHEQSRAVSMDGRYWDAPAARREGTSDVKKETPDREKTIAARARQRAIGRELRRIYDEVVQEPVPEDFLELLKKIDATRG
jgi:Anti-sigma factor NepR